LSVVQTQSASNEQRTTDNGLLAHFNRINYADDGCVDRAFFAPESHSRGAALHDQHGFLNARAYSIDRDDVSLFVTAIDIDKTRDKQLSPVKAVVLSRRYNGSNYSSKNHNQVSGFRFQVSGVNPKQSDWHLTPGT
jgi:hypothetical protein